MCRLTSHATNALLAMPLALLGPKLSWIQIYCEASGIMAWFSFSTENKPVENHPYREEPVSVTLLNRRKAASSACLSTRSSRATLAAWHRLLQWKSNLAPPELHRAALAWAQHGSVVPWKRGISFNLSCSALSALRFEGQRGWVGRGQMDGWILRVTFPL